MGAATRTSTAAGVEALESVVGPKEQLGDELLTAAWALASSHQLLSVLADVGIPAEQRVALIQRVFAGLDVQTRGILATLASGRWSEPVDLVAGVEEVGYRSLAASPSGEGLDSELFSVLQTVGSDGRLELALGGQSSPVEARLALVNTLLADASPATRTILRHIVQLPRGRKPLEALRAVQAIVAEARDRVVAVVQTATPLTPAQSTALAARLQQGYGRKISINQVLDPSLLGGVRITVGDDVIDGTVRARLDDLRLRLAG